ncbi:MAG: glycosyltransferase [Cyanobacteria bacterium P01_C01_bin.70]
MKINILTIGSRGDVQPYLALGVGLQQAGHRVQLTTHETFKELITRYGLEFFPIGGNPQDMLRGEAGQATVESGRNPIKVIQGLTQMVEPVMAECLEQSWQSCQNADAIISSGVAFWGDDIAQVLKLPSFFGLLQPVSVTTEFPHFLAATANLGGPLNWITYQFIARFWWQLFKPSVNPWREKQLGLPPHRSCPFLNQHWQALPKLYGYSPTVVPKPTDWNDTCHVTGYWFLEAPDDFTPPADLLDFLSDGEPPVYIGFGSMSSRDSEAMTQISLSALQQSGQRGVLLTGWGGITQTDLPDSVFKLDGIPHAWLFPRMKAIVHHGGAGTTAAALRSGVPNIVVPFSVDQPFWGDRAVRLGVSPDSIPKKQLSTERLTAAIQQATQDEQLQAKASAIGNIINHENGVQKAVQIINNYLVKGGSPATALK